MHYFTKYTDIKPDINQKHPPPKAFKLLLKALKAEGILNKNKKKLQEPFYYTSGILDKSAVYFYFIPDKENGDEGINIIVKYDLKERAISEWSKIHELRRINIKNNILLPINRQSDGLIICRAAEGYTLNNRCKRLDEYIYENFEEKINFCLSALELILKQALQPFHSVQPGAFRSAAHGNNITYGLFFSEILENEDTISSVIKSAFQDLDLTADTLPFSYGQDIANEYYNPLKYYNDYLNKAPGSVKLSRIHGDLNFTNILLEYNPNDSTPKNVFVIDFANSEGHAMTAIDFARIECEFWQKSFVNIVQEMQEFSNNNNFIETFIIIHKALASVDNIDYSIFSTEFTLNCYKFIYKLRSYAAKCLSIEGIGEYLPVSYFIILYLTAMKSLTYETVKNNEIKIRITFWLASYILTLIKNNVNDGFILPVFPYNQFVKRLKERIKITNIPDALLNNTTIKKIRVFDEMCYCNSNGEPEKCTLLKPALDFLTEYSRIHEITDDRLQIIKYLRKMYSHLDILSEGHIEINEKTINPLSELINEFEDHFITGMNEYRKGINDGSIEEKIKKIMLKRLKTNTNKEVIEKKIGNLCNNIGILKDIKISFNNKIYIGQTINRLKDTIPRLLYYIHNRWDNHYEFIRDKFHTISAVSSDNKKNADDLYMLLKELPQHKEGNDAPLPHWSEIQRER